MLTSYDGFSDEQLLERTRYDAVAFGVFYHRHERVVMTYFRHRVRDPEIAADLTAETFAAALASSHRFRPKPDRPPIAWLFGIARNVLGRSAARRAVETRARDRLGIPVRDLDDAALEEIECIGLGDDALSALDDLPPDQAAAIRARILDEREYPEIARQQHATEALVRQRVSRGLATLRRRLTQKERLT